MCRRGAPALEATIHTDTRYVRGNDLLDALSGADRAHLSRDIKVVALSSRRWLASDGAPVHHIDFPIDAVISIVATLRNGDAVEVGATGREGFVETDAALESEAARRGSFCQVSGDVARMSLFRFRERMDDSPSFARLMRRNVTATLFAAQQFAVCKAKHRVEQQCARWLLMTSDRVGRSRFPLTHESLAALLGVRRASVSQASHSLQASGAIVQERGMVTIARLDALRFASCECYEDCKDAFHEALTEGRLATLV